MQRFSPRERKPQSIAALALLLLVLALSVRLDAAVVGIYGAETGDATELSACSGCTIEDTSPIKTGNFALEMPTTAGSTYSVGSSGGSTFTAAVNYRFNTAPGSNDDTQFGLGDGGSVYCTFRMDTDRTVDAIASGGTSSESSTVLTVDTDYLVELQYTVGTGADAVCTLKIDGTQEAQSTDGTGTTNADRAYFLPPVSGLLHFDDLVLRNDSTYPGDTKIVALRPDGESSVEAPTSTWFFIDTPLTNCSTAGNCPPRLDDAPIDAADTSAIQRTNSGANTALFTTTTQTIDTVVFLQAGIWALRGTGGGTTHGIRTRVNGTSESSGDLGFTTSFAYYRFSPSTQPTTQSHVDGIELGMEHSGAQDYDIAEIWGMLAYTESTGIAPAQFINFPLTF